ncbi:MAG TPA: VOC family protein [Burkholderiales bacterium]|nr:VOC family protein [Burkholderiales bacterium]
MLDHVAHYVEDLGAAGALLEQLGFAPTPVSNHQIDGKPAGTANRCLMLPEGYIEILAPTLDTPQAARARELMKRYPGIHLVAFGTPDAKAEHARLAAHRFAPEPVVPLRRKISRNRLLEFNVAYAPPGKMPEGRIQYCEHLTPQHLWDAPSLAHQNGVRGLSSVYVVADDPAAVAARWAEYTGTLPFPDGKFVRIDLSRGKLLFASRNLLKPLMENVPDAPGVAAIGMTFKDPQAFAKRCKAAGLEVRKNALTLPAALGGTWILEKASA